LRITAFDDGWLELPGMARSLALARRQLRAAALLLVIFVGGLAALVGVGRLLAKLGLHQPWPSIVPLVGFLALAATVWVVNLRLDLHKWRASGQDREQARADKVAGRHLEMVPGAPKWRRATSAAEFASWVRKVTLVRRVDIVSINTTDDGADQVATVTMRDGSVRRYRSPDRTLGRLLETYDPHHLGT
jgi:hypothetical protein